jgi:predicted GNAT superfamily acetyltransferase
MAAGRRAAEAAAAAAGVRVADLHEVPRLREVSGLFGRIWGPRQADHVSHDLMRALSWSGNFVAAALSEGAVVGGIVGFRGWREGRPLLHSHILGVEPGHRRRGVAAALKQHQRAWSLERGIETVTWTYDPLVRRNAHFNLMRLGGTASAYHPDFYGEMRDDVNAGDASDRIVIRWALREPRAVAAAEGGLEEPALDALRGRGAGVLLAEDAGRPVAMEETGEPLLCRVPDDILDLRRREPSLNGEWRRALRETLGWAMGHGWSVAAFLRGGWYVLEPVTAAQPAQRTRPRGASLSTSAPPARTTTVSSIWTPPRPSS